MFHQEASVFQGYVSTKTKTPFQLKIRTITWCVFLFVVGGVIGNRSDAILLQLWSVIINYVGADRWPWIITGGAVLMIFGAIRLWWVSSVKASREQNEKSFLVSLVITLGATLSSVLATQDLNHGWHEFVAKAFETIAIDYLQNVRRGLLFLPDEKGENLIISDMHGWVDESSKNQTRFCIDSRKDSSTRGLAGEVFLTRRIIVAHISTKKDVLRSDEVSYIPSLHSKPPFCGSLIGVPITTGEGTSDCLGVLCFDSYNSTAFDTPIVRDILVIVASRVAEVLVSLAKEKTRKEVLVK